MGIKSKSELAVILSKLETSKKSEIKLEQYNTPSELAAEMLWNSELIGDISGKVILDAACGNGILGLGALLLGAKKVFFIDISKDCIDLSSRNYQKLNNEFEAGEAEFIVGDIADFNKKADVVIQNPPFGTKQKHADRMFLELAFTVGKVVYSVHKITSKRFIEAICKDYHFKITHLWKKCFPIPYSQRFHRKKIYNVDIGIWRLER